MKTNCCCEVLWGKILLCGITVVLLMMIGFSGWYSMHVHKYTFCDKPIERRYLNRESLRRIDSVYTAYLKEQNDSVKISMLADDYIKLYEFYVEIDADQKHLLEQHENLINDLRQETNNNLDKLNFWLTFWIGIIGLCGVVIPILTQLIVYKNSESKIKDLNRKIELHRFHMLSNSLFQGFDNHVLNENEEGRKLFKLTWSKLVVSFESVCDQVMYNDKDRRLDTNDIVICLMQAHSLLNRIYVNYNDRSIRTLSMRMSNLSKEIVEKKFLEKADKENLLSIIHEMTSVTLE